MRDLCLKYQDIHRDFPNRAGKLRSVLETQKRLIDSVKQGRPGKDVQALLVTTAEGYDVGMELLDYMGKLLEGVANDATALHEGAEIRNVVKMQELDIRRSWELTEKYMAVIVELNALKRKYEPA